MSPLFSSSHYTIEEVLWGSKLRVVSIISRKVLAHCFASNKCGGILFFIIDRLLCNSPFFCYPECNRYYPYLILYRRSTIILNNRKVCQLLNTSSDDFAKQFFKKCNKYVVGLFENYEVRFVNN
jgi:hypothetical protein